MKESGDMLKRRLSSTSIGEAIAYFEHLTGLSTSDWKESMDDAFRRYHALTYEGHRLIKVNGRPVQDGECILGNFNACLPTEGYRITTACRKSRGGRTVRNLGWVKSTMLNAKIALYVNGVEADWRDAERIQLAFFWVLDRYKTSNRDLYRSNLTMYDVIMEINRIISLGMDSKSMEDQMDRNCMSRYGGKVYTVGNASLAERHSISHIRISDAARSMILEHPEISVRKMIVKIQEELGEKVSMGSISSIRNSVKDESILFINDRF